MERPILMSAPMVRAILAGEKTQTRRAVKGEALKWLHPTMFSAAFVSAPENSMCPYGTVGDRLWVRESFCPIHAHGDKANPIIEVDFRATYQDGARLGDSIGIKKRWTPSIHMPRALSRITLEVTAVRIERLQGISDSDCIAEGIGLFPSAANIPMTGQPPLQTMANSVYRQLWESINGAGSWELNPWVWVIEFKRVA